MKRQISICMAYYRNAGMLHEQIKRFAAMPRAILDQIEILVCDDGSPDGEAQGEPIGCPLKVFRIDVDVRWNQDAARNICAHHADCQWLLFTDIDHLIPMGTLQALLTMKLGKRTVYKFSRHTADKLKGHGGSTFDSYSEYKPHPNTWLMTKAFFWEIGGYDERFAGLYGTDAEFRDRVVANLLEPPKQLALSISRVPRTTIPDASTTTYVRKEVGVDDVGMRRVREDREREINWRPKNLTFPYRQIWPKA